MSESWVKSGQHWTQSVVPAQHGGPSSVVKTQRASRPSLTPRVGQLTFSLVNNAVTTRLWLVTEARRIITQMPRGQGGSSEPPLVRRFMTPPDQACNRKATETPATEGRDGFLTSRHINRVCIHQGWHHGATWEVTQHEPGVKKCLQENTFWFERQLDLYWNCTSMMCMLHQSSKNRRVFINEHSPTGRQAGRRTHARTHTLLNPLAIYGNKMQMVQSYKSINLLTVQPFPLQCKVTLCWFTLWPLLWSHRTLFISFFVIGKFTVWVATSQQSLVGETVAQLIGLGRTC